GVCHENPATVLEQKSYYRTASKPLRRQRIDVRFVTEVREHGRDESWMGADARAQLARELDGARVAVARKLQILPTLETSDRGKALAERRALGIAHCLRERRLGEKLLIVSEDREIRASTLRRVEHRT